MTAAIRGAREWYRQRMTTPLAPRSTSLREVGEGIAVASSAAVALGAIIYAVVFPYSEAFYAIFYLDLRTTQVAAGSGLSYGSAPAIVATLGGAALLGYLTKDWRKDSRTFRTVLLVIFFTVLPIAAFLQLEGAVAVLRSAAWGLFCFWVWSTAALVFRGREVRRRSVLWGATLIVLESVDFTGSIATEKTIWPPGFDPARAQVKVVQEATKWGEGTCG